MPTPAAGPRGRWGWSATRPPSARSGGGWRPRTPPTSSGSACPSPSSGSRTSGTSLPGFGVSFAMSPADVRRVLDVARATYEHRPLTRQRWPDGGSSHRPEQIVARGAVPHPDGVRVVEVRYQFEGGRLEGVGLSTGG